MLLLEPILRQFSYWIVLLPLVLGIVFFKRLSMVSKWVVILMIVASIPQVLRALLPDWKYMKLVYNLYTVFDFAIMTQVLGRYLKDKFSRNTFIASILAFAAIGLFMMVKSDFLQVFVSQLVCVSSMIYLLWILAIIRECYIYNIPFFEKNDPLTYYLLGLIPYASATMVIFLIYNKINDSPEGSPLKYLFTFHDVLNSLMYIMFAVGLMIEGRRGINKMVYPAKKFG